MRRGETHSTAGFIVSHICQALFTKELKMIMDMGKDTAVALQKAFPDVYNSFSLSEFHYSYRLEDYKVPTDGFKNYRAENEGDFLHKEITDLMNYKQYHRKNREKMEYFLTLFLNVCRTYTEFAEPLGLELLENAIPSRANLKIHVCHYIRERQNQRPTRDSRYQLFLQDNKEMINTAREYAIQQLVL